MRNQKLGLMAVLAVGVGLAAVGTPVAAQQMVDVRILDIAARVPVPPATVEEAYRRAQCDPEGVCTVTSHYAAAARALADVLRRIEALNVTLQQPAANPMANVDPAELQRRIAAMSREEQIRFAQEMARAGGGGVSAPEPPAIQRLLAEATQLQDRAAQYTIATTVERRVQAFHAEPLIEVVRAKHTEIRNRTGNEISALPQPPAYAAEPVVAEYVSRRREIEDKGMQERFAAEQAYQQALAEAWQKELARLREFYGAFEDAMANNAFGANAVNNTTKTLLLGQQAGLAAFVEQLLQASTDASLRGAQLWMEKLIMERERTGR